MPLASPAVSIRPPANATTPKTGDAAKRILLIKNVDPDSDRDSGEIRARLLELRHGPWNNNNGQGSRARMIVADATGDLQITAFEGVDALVARLRVNTAYRFPLAGAVITLKNEKWNRTTGSAYEVKLSKLGVQHVREEDDDRGLPAHSFSFVSIAAIGQLAARTQVHVLGVIVATSGVVTAPNKVKGTETSRRGLRIADASGKSIEVTVFATGVQHIDGEVGRVITIKGDTGTFRGVPTLTASLANVDFEPTLSEADELRERWARTPPEVTPLLPSLTYKPIASLANEPSTEPVDLLGVIASVEAPVLYTAANGTQARRVGMVVCDASEAAVPLTLFAPAEGALPAFAPGKLLSVAGASMETYAGELKCRTWLDRATLEPHGPEAADLRQWWASRPASYVAPSVTIHPLVPIDSVPSLPADTYVRIVAVVLDAEGVVTAPTSKGGEASRRMLTIADASGKSVELTIWAPRMQDIGGDAGYIIALKKARTRVFRGAPSLTAFLEDVDFAPTLPEAQALYELWARTPPEVTPLLPSLTYKPIASLANEPSTEPVDLLGVIASVEAPVLYTAANGTQARRVGMVVCDASEAAVPLTLFAPAEGALPTFAPGKLLSVAGASMETYAGELKCRTWLDRATLEPHGPEAADLRQWWASRPASYVAPSVTIHPLVPIDSVPSLPADTYVRIVAVVLDAEGVVTAPTSKGGEASRRMLTIADASGKSVELTIWAPRMQDIGGDAGYIIALKKARTRVFRGAPSLTAFLEDVDFAPTLPEAQALYELWARTPPEVTPLLPSLTYKPIASLATATNEPSTDPIDLLAVIVSADPPVLYTAESSGKQGRRVGMLVCDREAAVPLTLFAPAEGALPTFAPGTLLSVSGATLETFRGEPTRTRDLCARGRSHDCWFGACTGEPRCKTFLNRVTLGPSDAAALALRGWWQARADDDPPPTVSSVWSCMPLADLPHAYETGEQTLDALGVVTGDASTVSLDSGEVAEIMTLCDQSGSVRLRVVRDGEQAPLQYHDGMSLAVAAAKPGIAEDGHLTLVACQANLRLFPKADRAHALHEWYRTRAAGMRDEPAPVDTFGDQFGWESAFDFGAPPPSLPPSPPSSPPPTPPPPDDTPRARQPPSSPITVLSPCDSPTTYYDEDEAEVARAANHGLEAEAAADACVQPPSAAPASKCWPPPLRLDDAVALRERSAAIFDALVTASDVKYGRLHPHDEELAQMEQLLESVDPKARAALDSLLSRSTSQDGGECSRKAGVAAAALTDNVSSSSGSSSPSTGAGAEGSSEGSPLLDGALKRRRVVLDDEEVPRCSLGCVAGEASEEEAAMEEGAEEEEEEEEEEEDDEAEEVADEPTAPAGAASRKGRRAAGCRFLQREAEASDGSDDDSAEESASDADSDGNLKGFTVKDAEASASNYETDEELETPPALRRRQKGTREAAAAEALLGCKLEGLKVMRIEAQRAQEVVDGEKTLELTGKLCHQRGVVLVGETSEGASAKGCAIGAVTLGECASLNRGSFEATAARHRALDFPPALAWLEQGTLHAQVRHPPRLPRLLTQPRLP